MSSRAVTLTAFGPLVLYAAAALVLMVNWESIPERIPVHWGFSGEPDRWAARGFWSIYAVLVAGAVVSLALGASVWKARPRSMTGGYVAIGYGMALLFCYVALRPLIVEGEPLGAGFWVLLGLLFGLAIAVAVGSVRDGMREPAEHWKLGVLYHNPENPSLWVPKRFGLGWTLNFANPLSWVVLASIAALPLILILLR
jgi:uncharacterized membrane protein